METFGTEYFDYIGIKESIVRDWMMGRVEETSLDAMHLLAGRFEHFPETEVYLEDLKDIFHIVYRNAQRDKTRELWEKALELAVEIRRLSKPPKPGMDVDVTIPNLLLRLHRDHDAICFIQYWIQMHSKRPGNSNVDDQIRHSKRGEWPFLCSDNALMLDIAKDIRDFHSLEDATRMPLSLFLTPLTIKLRCICVYRKSLTLAQVFLKTTRAEKLPQDIGLFIASFLIGGEKAPAVYATHLDHANQLLNCIDEHFPNVISEFLDDSGPLKLRTPGQYFRKFFHSIRASDAVVDTLRNTLKIAITR